MYEANTLSVIQVGDEELEKVYAYGSWLSRLLPNRKAPGDMEVIDDMMDCVSSGCNGCRPTRLQNWNPSVTLKQIHTLGREGFPFRN